MRRYTEKYIKEVDKAETETVRRIHHVNYHQVIEVSENSDGGMIEIRQFEDGKKCAEVRMSHSSAEQVAQAILHCVRELKEQGK